eukprot:TRINITY_DN11262_c1_g1_i1.p1 TRINITY_DN11262_c1_g1~~TRINITY_DN11262_c1_g1_i1.p1  ORF type:complete len:108 (-),score=41.15 TRINITY_DN11262_c1_g1_i1:7-285(-)
MLLRQEMEGHLEICEEVVVECEKCGESLKRKVLDHDEVCVEEMVKCVSVDIGCDFEDKRKVIKDHQKICALVKIRFVILSFQEKHLYITKST